MHKIFGKRQNGEYYDRKGAYLIPVKNSKIAVVKTAKGLFLLGGGIEAKETDLDCIKRECLEEIGYTVAVGDFLCSGEMYLTHSEWGLFHPIQHYYAGMLLTQVQEPKEKDHILLWGDYDALKNQMFREVQCWALQEAWKKYRHK